MGTTAPAAQAAKGPYKVNRSLARAKKPVWDCFSHPDAAPSEMTEEELHACAVCIADVKLTRTGREPLDDSLGADIAFMDGKEAVLCKVFATTGTFSDLTLGKRERARLGRLVRKAAKDPRFEGARLDIVSLFIQDDGGGRFTRYPDML